MKSKHLTGHAVDLVAFIKDRISWEFSFYDEIANAMRISAVRKKVSVRWGGAWNTKDIRKTKGKNMVQIHLAYIDARRKQGRQPFIDGPHFELS